MNVNYGLPFMTMYPVNLEKWCKRYELEVRTQKCKYCGRTITLNIPLFTKYRRGLYSEPCECGSTSTPFSYIDFRYECN
jgi:hypothetical protein